MPLLIDVYLKPGCPLCDEALELLDDAAGAWRFQVALRNILADDTLFERYRHAVPVVVMGGVERLRLRFDRQELEAALLASGCEPT
jgi:thiol-disulfide isomerase/thioredoxin